MAISLWADLEKRIALRFTASTVENAVAVIVKVVGTMLLDVASLEAEHVPALGAWAAAIVEAVAKAMQPIIDLGAQASAESGPS